MRQAIKNGTVVWDIGANVGLYTSRFAEWAGARGRIVAFEPLPQAQSQLETVVASLKSRYEGITGQASFENIEADADGVCTTAHIADNPVNRTGGSDGISVAVDTADNALSTRSLPKPVVVKIDVEGYEAEVLLGGSSTFGAMSCRDIFVEVHFTRLHERQQDDAPTRMVRLLQEWGFKVTWLDPSHLHAQRIEN